MWRVVSSLSGSRVLALREAPQSLTVAKASLRTCLVDRCDSFSNASALLKHLKEPCVYTGLRPIGVGALYPVVRDTLRFGSVFRIHMARATLFCEGPSRLTPQTLDYGGRAVECRFGSSTAFESGPKRGARTSETLSSNVEQSKTKLRHRWPANLRLRARWGIVNRQQYRRLSAVDPTSQGSWFSRLGNIARGVIRRVHEYKEGLVTCQRQLKDTRWSQGRSKLKQHLSSQRRLLQRHRQSLQFKRQQLALRVRQSLLEHQRRVLKELKRGGTEWQRQRDAWAERRTQKLAEAMAMLNAQTESLQRATASAKERLRQLWKLYGWTAIVSYTIVHVTTLLALFGVVSAVPPQKLAGFAQAIRVGDFVGAFCKDFAEDGAGTWWSCWLVAYFAAKALTPVQVALAIWLTPALSRMVGHKIGAVGGKAAAAAARGARRTLHAAGIRRL